MHSPVKARGIWTPSLRCTKTSPPCLVQIQIHPGTVEENRKREREETSQARVSQIAYSSQLREGSHQAQNCKQNRIPCGNHRQIIKEQQLQRQLTDALTLRDGVSDT